VIAFLAIVIVAMCCMPAFAAADNAKRPVDGGEVIVGRVMFVDPRAGTVIVEFPSGPQRLRPQWNAPLPAPREPARPR